MHAKTKPLTCSAYIDKAISGLSQSASVLLQLHAAEFSFCGVLLHPGTLQACDHLLLPLLYPVMECCWVQPHCVAGYSVSASTSVPHNCQTLLLLLLLPCLLTQQMWLQRRQMWLQTLVRLALWLAISPYTCFYS